MPDFRFLHASPFYELAALLALAATLGFLGLLLRQPMIVSSIAVSVLVFARKEMPPERTTITHADVTEGEPEWVGAERGSRRPVSPLPPLLPYVR